MNLKKIDVINPLDIDKNKKNFLNKQSFSDEYKKLAKIWSQYPVYSDKVKLKEFFNLLDEKQVILIQSSTGSGKTVIIPKLVLKYMHVNKNNKIIAVTNPKILTTKNNAEFGAKTLDCELGKEVGYKFKGENKTTENITKLLYCTDGTITATILNKDPLLMDYNCIIIDEIHERQINIDLLLYFLRNVVIKRPEFKLILMSATIDSNVFKKYYNDFINGNGNINNNNKNSKIKYGEILFSGQTNYKINQTFVNDKQISRKNYVEKGVELIIKNIIDKTKQSDGDIIMFCATETDIKKGCQLLKELCPQFTKELNKCDETFCIEVYSKMSLENKKYAIDIDYYKTIDNKYSRKVIFATNVAESSITFDGLVYVIDSGYELTKYFNAENNSYVINKQMTSQAQIKQRIGRVGRNKEGFAYHLYSEYDYKKLLEYPLPSINNQDITEYILSFFKKISKIDDLKDNDKIDPLHNVLSIINNLVTKPTNHQVILSLFKLYFYKMIKIFKNKNRLDKKLDEFKKVISLDNKQIYTGKITKLGSAILNFKSIKTESAYAIILSHYFNCHSDIITIISILEACEYNIKTLFIDNDKNKQYIKNYFNKYVNIYSDHLTILNIYNNLYLKDEFKFLNKFVWNKIKDIIRDIKKLYKNVINKYTQKGKKLVNKKQIKMYNSMKKSNNQELNENENNIVYTLYQAFSFNLIKNMNSTMNIKNNQNGNKNVNEQVYQNVFYHKNKAVLEKLNNISINTNNDINKKSKYAICDKLSSKFGKNSFECITFIPNQWNIKSNNE